MHPISLRGLRCLARSYGVQLDYTDPQGRLQAAPPESLLAVLRALGAELEHTDDAAGALRARRLALWRRVLEPVVVAWDGGGSFALRIPERDAGARLECAIATQEGETRRWSPPPDAGRRVRVEGEAFVQRRIALPPRLPPGEHRLHVGWSGAAHEALVLAAPRRVSAELGRSWGAFIPLYAVRSETDAGCGDFGDLRRLLDWVRALGGATVGTLPILPAFLDECFEPSPYVPVSRLFWNELFIDLEAIPELQRCDTARALLEGDARATLRAAPLVDYRRVMQAKRRVLDALAQRFFEEPTPERLAAHERFVAARPEVVDYARFRAASERFQSPWSHWPDAAARAGLQAGADLPADTVRTWVYAQWIAHEQVDALRGLYLDFPVGVNASGYDTWRYRDAFALGTRVGAPPDPLFTQGQDWGFPPLHPERQRDTGYAYLRACLRHHFRSAGCVRIDHVMGLHRLFWIPPGCDTRHGVYVCNRAEELYAVLALEAHRAGAAVVGENLGIVPARVEAAMQRHRLHRLYVLQFAMFGGPEALAPPPPDAVAGLSTHDMPSFAGFWRGLDIDDRLDLGFVTAEQAAAEHAERARLRERFAAWEREGGEAAVLAACLDFLARSPAAMVLVDLEDLWLETAPHNVPSTWRERPNWMRKASRTLEDVQRDPEVRRALQAVDRARRLT